MKWVFAAWALFVYGLFCWNTVPSFYERYRPHPGTAAVQQAQPGPQTVPVNTPEPVLSENTPSEEIPAPKTPVHRSAAHNLILNLLRALCALAVLHAAYAVGRRVLLMIPKSGSFQTPPIETAIGLGGIALLVLAWGVLGWYTTAGFIVLLALLLLILALEFKNILSQISLNLSSRKVFTVSTFLLGGALAALFYRAFIPDQFFDTLAYHLALPQSYLNAGKFFPAFYNFNWGLPQTMEMLSTFGLGLGGTDTIPLLFQWGVTALIVMFLMKQEEGRTPWAALLWLSCPMVVENARFLKNDLFLSLCLTLAAFIILDLDEASDNPAPAVTAGLLCGFAMGTKYTGMTFAGLFSALLVWKMRRLGMKKCAFLWTAFCVSAFAVFLPWLIKNWAAYGNPLYPFLQERLGFQYMASENWRSFIGENNQFLEPGWHASYLYRIPWRNTFWGFEYPIMNFIGPVWLASLPVLLTVGMRSKWVREALFLSGVIYIFSTTQTTLARYFFLPILPIFALAAAKSAEQVQDAGSRKLLHGFFALGIAIQAIGWLPALEQVSYGRKAIVGLSAEKESKLYAPGYFDAFQWVNGNLPEKAKILFIGETKSHRFERKTIVSAVHNRNYLSDAVGPCRSEEDLFNKLSSDGFTHILLNRDELARLTNYPMYVWKEGDKKILEEFWRKHLKENFSSGPILIYAVSGSVSIPATVPDELNVVFQ